MARLALDKTILLGKLNEQNYKEDGENDEGMLEQMSLSRSLLKLAGIDHEKVAALCREVAQRLLTNIPEPEYFDEE